MGTESHGFQKEIAGLPKKGVMRILIWGNYECITYTINQKDDSERRY